MSNIHTKPVRHLFVNSAGWSFDADPKKYFSTITAALAAAAALVPVPSQANPVLIYVYPGSYAESPTMGVSGVSLSALPQYRSFLTQIVGTLTISLGAGVDRDLNHVTVTGLGMQKLRFTGLNPQKLYISDCTVEVGGDDAFRMDNTGVDTGARKSQVIAQNLTCRCTAGAFFSLNKLAGDLELFHGFIRQTPDTAVAVNIAGAAPSSGFCAFAEVDIDGKVACSGIAGITLALSDVSVTGAPGVPIITNTGTGTVVIAGTSVVTGSSPAISGGALAALVYSDIIFAGAGSGFAAGTIPVALNNFRSFVPATPGNWAAPAPNTLEAAVNRLAAKVFLLNGSVPIP